ncbi:LysM peptidoglycan-binding domain-containing protein [Simiduia sp. 21SJ11W-1]|uniref:FimV/HubP family polar landmark protein n=1 Tax=Simiduia sp. 21SJ11W-1 TaxID=2909669 RepID=UPI00209CF8CD|nr:FimV/HubP family polar landmark protein [Simiduia sp. 21SJ11W-1]UTA49279.1 LysM peptidoglycan-binding domain-containing protein [Simiduia sp. 21SJ11W-1]
MRLRKLALSIGVSAALVSNLGFALGLGEIKLNSALNQPLDAQIKLLQVRDLSEEEIVVQLASREAYERANVERLFFLSGMKFEVVLDNPSNPHIRVTTQENVREPYLNFLLETQWPTGRMLREYTVLMDLPTFSEKNQKAVSAPSQSAPASVPVRPRPAVKPAQPTAAAHPAPRPVTQSAPAGDYTVRANDTLWDIALMARPDRGYSVQQTMLAIQRLNPDAFINNNINLLKKGQVLRLPSAEEISSLSTRQAINEVAYQNSQWSGGAALDASRRSGAVASQSSGREGRVQLSSGSSSSDVNTGSGRGRNVEALENELAIAQEELGAAQRQNEDLRGRVSDLEEQIETMERLLEVTNEELRALQLNSAQALEGGETPAEPEAAPAQAAPASPEVAATPEPAKPNTVVVSSKPEPTLIDTLMDNILYIALGLLAVIGGLFFWKRKQEDTAAAEDELDFYEEPESEQEDDDPFALPDDLSSDYDDMADEQPVEDLEEQESAEAETADVAAEADIYIAYGKYDQAEEMLLKALAQEPGREDVTLKLLEVYAETKNLEAFDQHYAGLLETADGATQQRAEELRDSIPGAGEFDRTQVQAVAGAAALGAASAALSDDIDLDAGLDDSVDPLLSLAEEGADDEGFDALEGLEDLDTDFGDLAAEGAGESLDLDDTESLDFDLDDLDDDSGSAEELSLDLDSGVEESESADDFSLDLGDDDEFALDLDTEEDKQALSELSLDGEDDFGLSAEAEPATAADEEFSLSLDDAEDEPLSLDVEEEAFDLDLSAADADSSASAADDEEFALNLDDDGDLSVDLGDMGETAPAEEATESFDLSLDDELDLSAAEPEAPAVAAPAATPELSPDDEPESLSVEADDFDSAGDFGDMDLAALDEEMDTLSADLDLDDDLAALDDEPATEQEPEFDISADLGIEDGADELPPLAADDQVFDEALADAPAGGDDDEGVDAELGFLADSDEVATKLDLARAYIDMGDSEGARDILSEVLEEGDATQKGEAEELMSRIG